MARRTLSLCTIVISSVVILFILGPGKGFAVPQGAVEWPTSQGGNGHYYMAVLVPQGITRDEANSAASQAGGYLATITSAAENAFVYGLISGNNGFWYTDNYGNGEGPWLGGYQPLCSPEPDCGWRWVTEEPFSYTNWGTGEPNNWGGNESRLCFFGYQTSEGPYWNDVNPSISYERGYIIEFESELEDAIVGTWGYVRLEHGNDGSWGSTVGISTLNSDGSGTDTYNSNDEGNLTAKTKPFSYSTFRNQDGSITITQTYLDGTQILKYVLSDDEGMAIGDGSSDTGAQVITIDIKMDPLKTCANADFNGDYYAIAYDFRYYPPIPLIDYIAWSGIGAAYGNGTILKTQTENDNGTIVTKSTPDSYSVNPDCSGSFSSDPDNLGYLSGDGKLFVSSEPLSKYDWIAIFGMKKGDKTYSTADLAGTWAVAGFGDDNGNSFTAVFGSLTCDDQGNCTYSVRGQENGKFWYDSGHSTFSVSSDGSFGSSLPGSIAYAGAIGNNGNTIMLNFSFGEPNSRQIWVGVRCSNCSDLGNYTKIGVFSNGFWHIDLNGNGKWDGVTGEDAQYRFGFPGAMPVTGDWDGSGITKIGVCRNGTWYLDLNGNGKWDGVTGGDAQYSFGFPGAIPVTGDWDGSGITKIGVYDNGIWYLDLNGNGKWDGVTGGDAQYSFGFPGALPITGRYSWALVGERIPMLTLNPAQFGGGNGLNIYLYDPISGNMDTVKNNTYDSWFPSINPYQTKIAYTEGLTSGCYRVKVCDIPTLTCKPITAVTVKHAAYFDEDGKIVFIDCSDGKFKKMASDGSNIITLTSSLFSYDDVFSMSPDRNTIAATKTRRTGSYHTSNYQSIVLMDPNGNVKCSTPEFLGDWNGFFWKQDSSELFYYHHVFNVVNGIYQDESDKYWIVNLDCSIIDLSNSDLGQKDENGCFFTKSGNLLSPFYRELYNGETGALISYRPDVPLFDITKVTPPFGFDANGEIYFCDSVSPVTNCRRFVE